ncbi:MAG: hypothetical protein SV487_06305 [Thermodesulfobacteriota bacterium]|nr:hypothetical protein [Thermodesulfobacteriota bacterium]
MTGPYDQMTQTPMTRLTAVFITALALCGLLICAPGALAQDTASEPEPPLEEVLVGPGPSAPAPAPAPMGLEAKPEEPSEQTVPEVPAPTEQAAPEIPAPAPAPMGLEAKPEEPASTQQAVPETPAPAKQEASEKPKKQADAKKEEEKQPLWVKMKYIHGILEDYEGLHLSYPSKLFVDSVKREIYVTDSGNSRILVYTHDFYPILTIGKADGIDSPSGMAVDPKGRVFVTQPPGRSNPRSRITLLSPALTFKKNIYFNGFDNSADFRPINLAISKEGLLYVVGSGYAGVVVLNNDGTFSHIISPRDSFAKSEKEGDKAVLCDVEIDDAGRIYLLSEDMGRVYVYDSKENFLFKFGQKGGGSGKLSRPRGMGLDNRNKIILQHWHKKLHYIRLDDKRYRL